MTAIGLSSALIDGLARCGVTFVAACPGSRNAPLLRALHRHPEINTHVRIDERGAAFLALGAAKTTGRPAAVVVTSGTAVGNLLPAVMEAHHSQIPLLIVSADRPSELKNTGANQTTKQDGIFTDFVRGIYNVVEVNQLCLMSVVEAACGVHSANPGPVQINIEFSEPLLEGDVLDYQGKIPSRLSPVKPDDPESVFDHVSGTVVLVGDAPAAVGRQAADLARRCRLPLFAEPSSHARVPGAISTYRLLLQTPLAAGIRRVLLFGHPTLSRPQRALLTSAQIEVIQISELAGADYYPGVVEKVPMINLPVDNSGWLTTWQQAETMARNEVNEMDSALSSRRLAAAVLANLDQDQNLFFGSSALIRDADLAPVTARSPHVFANRGLSGIDGLISTAAGIALASARPTTALLGDLSFLHDLSALVVPSLEAQPQLRLVVGNDNGGSIFCTLEQGERAHADYFERFFAVPHDRSLAKIGDALGIVHCQISHQRDLAAAFSQPPQQLEIVEVILDRRGKRVTEQELLSRVQHRLRSSS